MKPHILTIKEGNIIGTIPKDMPIVVLITGEGVVTKPYALSERVVKSTDFYYTVNGDNVSFVRCDSVDEILKEVPNVVFIHVSGQADDKVISECHAIFRKEYYTIKNETVVRIARKRITPVMLVLFIALLTANFFINRNLQAKNSLAQQALNERRKMIERRMKDNSKQTKRRSDIQADIVPDAAGVIDKIASHVPEKITLTLLTINPLIRSPETNKPIQVRRNVMLICGTASSMNDIPAFADSLSLRVKKMEGDKFELEGLL